MTVGEAAGTTAGAGGKAEAGEAAVEEEGGGTSEVAGAAVTFEVSQSWTLCPMIKEGR